MRSFLQRTHAHTYAVPHAPDERGTWAPCWLAWSSQYRQQRLPSGAANGSQSAHQHARRPELQPERWDADRGPEGDSSQGVLRPTCAHRQRGGQKVDISAHQEGTDGQGGPLYCALTGTIDTHIGFEILLPVTTWRQRYLQIGCGGLCGSIGLSAPQTTAYAPLADGDFVVASQDEGHSGQGTTWSTNGEQLIDFAYTSDHLLSQVSKGLADAVLRPRPEVLLLRRLLAGRASGADRGPAVSEGLQRRPGRCSGEHHDGAQLGPP